jgi:hypothetical protein
VYSYYVEISPGCLVWATPILLRGGPYLKNEENSLRGANNVVDSNPARVKGLSEKEAHKFKIAYETAKKQSQQKKNQL